MGEETKTYVFGDNGQNSNLLSTLVPLLQKQGIDPNMLAMMNNNGGWGNGNNFLWVLFLLFLWNGNGWGNGFGGNGSGAGFLSNQISNNEGRDLLMQAIQGNRDAISNLATTLNADFGQVSDALNSISTQLCGIGKDIGMTGMQVINALQQGNMAIAQQIAQASSQSQLGMCQQTNILQSEINNTRNGIQGEISSVRNGLQSAICDAKTTLNGTLHDLSFQNERQSCDLKGVVRDQVDRVVAVKQALLDKIDALREENSSMKSVAATSQIVAQAINPVVAQLNGLQTDFAAYQAKQPVTYPVQYQPFVAVPNGVAYAYGATGSGNGFWGY